MLFYEYDKSKGNEKEMIQYFTRKVKKYRQQYKKANRPINDEHDHCQSVLAGMLPVAPSLAGMQPVFRHVQ